MYLVDTNVFYRKINSCIGAVAIECKKKEEPMNISQAILDELQNGANHPEATALHKGVYISVNNLITGIFAGTIGLVQLEDIDGAKEIFNRIRKNYYSWMYNTAYLQKLVDEGKITKAEIRSRSFRNKDIGECELIAIAVASNGKYIIVSNDRGRVYKHPDQNIYKPFDGKVLIYTENEWLTKSGLYRIVSETKD